MPASRVKDAGFLQRHIEKLVLGVGLVVLLLAVLLFIVGNPFAIEVGGKTYASPDEIKEDLELMDGRLVAGLNNPNPIEDDKKNVPPFDIEIAEMLELKPRPIQVAAGSLPGLTQGAIKPIPPEPTRYAVVTPPTPGSVEHVIGTDVLDLGFNPQEADAFMALMGKAPGDDNGFTMLIAAADFPIWDWATRLKDAAPAPGTSKIPVGIWAQRFGIAGVVLLREEWDPANEVWVDRRYVDALPSQIRVMPTSEVPFEREAAVLEIEKMRQAQELIARPSLPWVGDEISGFVQVVAPGRIEDENAVEGFNQFGGRLTLDDLGPAERQILEWEEKIEDLEQRKADAESRRRPRPDRPVRPGARDDDGFGGGGGGSADRPSRDPWTRQIEDLRRKIEAKRPEAEREKAARERAIAARIAREEAMKRREALLGGTDAVDLQAGAQIGDIQLSEGQTVRVWAADPTMRPGKSYRYKLVVSVINPLYGVPRLASDQLAENRGKAAILPSQEEIDRLEWIGPVTVEPEQQFFFAGGGESRAKVEVFRRVEGVMQMRPFDVSPGDLIGGVAEIEPLNELDAPKAVNMNIGAVLVDIETRRDPLTGSSSAVMLFVDREGRLHERVQTVDNRSPLRQMLVREVKDGPQWPLRPAPDEVDAGQGGDGLDAFEAF